MAVRPPFGTLNATISKTIITNAPKYTKIVEPFGDGGTLALTLAKKKPREHLLNIETPELFEAMVFAQNITSADKRQLKGLDWIGSQETFDKADAITATEGVDAFYKFMYLKKFGTKESPDGPVIFDILRTGQDVSKSLLGMPLMKIGLKGVTITNEDSTSALNKGGAGAFTIILPKKPEHIEAAQNKIKTWSGEFFFAAKVKGSAQVVEAASTFSNLNVSPLTAASIMMNTMAVVTNYENKLPILDAAADDLGLGEEQKDFVVLEAAQKTIELYARRLRGLVNGLWNGSIDRSTFKDSVERALRREFNNAWTEGARTQGIEPDERTTAEQKKLDAMISEQSGFISGLADWVKDHLKADGFKLSDAQSRVPMWTNRYNEVMNIAKTMAGADRKLKWALGPTEHCSSCLKLNGKVKRGSQWDAADIRPQHPDLVCKGFNCQCSLNPTTDRASAGRLPSIP